MLGAETSQSTGVKSNAGPLEVALIESQLTDLRYTFNGLLNPEGPFAWGFCHYSNSRFNPQQASTAKEIECAFIGLILSGLFIFVFSSAMAPMEVFPWVRLS